MARQKSLKLNFVMNAILTMSNFIFPLITFPYVSRVLQPSGTGAVNFGTSLIYYFAMFSQLGIPTYGVRACAKVRDDRLELTRVAHELLFINLVMSVLAYVVLGICLFTVPRLFEDRTLYVIMSLQIILTAIGMEWLYRAMEQYTYITVRSIIFKAISIVAMFLLVHARSDYVIYGAITIFAGCASNVFNLLNAHRFIEMRPVGGYRPGRHMKAILIFFGMSAATTIYTQLDTVMLGFMKTKEDVGYYTAAVRIKQILVSIVTSLGTVLLPRASYYVERGQMREFRRISAKAINFVFLLAAPMSLYFMFFARAGIFFLSGDAYEGSVMPMILIMPTLLLIGLSNITGIQVLIPLGREKTVLFSEIWGGVVDLILNALLIPRIASSGAAIGTLVAEMVVLFVQVRALGKEILPAFTRVRCGLLVLALVLGSAASVWVNLFHLDGYLAGRFGSTMGYFLVLVITAVCFFGVYLAVLLIGREELAAEIVGQLVSKVRRKKK